MPVITIRKNNTYSADDLFQWDTNRSLVIYGLNLSVLPEIHFANSKMDKAIVKQAVSDNDAFKVEIPNSLLETAIPIHVWICYYENDEFISKYAFKILVKSRPKPEDYFAEDDEKIYSYNALENLVNNTIVNLQTENEDFHTNMTAEVERLCNQLKNDVEKSNQNTVSQVNQSNKNTENQVKYLLENTEISNADEVDGYHAEEFVFASKSGTTVFNSDGSITTTYTDGSSEKIVFNADGSITTTRNTLSLGVKTETTTFNADGSITVTAN